MSDMLEGVKKFHEVNGLPVADRPKMVDENRKRLRVKLLEEEVKELKDAFEADDLVEAYDACIDVLYLTLGTLVEMGLSDKLGFDEVQKSNMSKLGEDGKPILSRGEELDGYPLGKVLKGPNYFQPQPGLERVIKLTQLAYESRVLARNFSKEMTVINAETQALRKAAGISDDSQ
jgi:predicted HAD superfamily Cof-like phosphohydrolase